MALLNGVRTVFEANRSLWGRAAARNKDLKLWNACGGPWAAPPSFKLVFLVAARRIISIGPRVSNISTGSRLCQRRTSRLCMPLPRRVAPQRAPWEGPQTRHSPGVPLVASFACARPRGQLASRVASAALLPVAKKGLGGAGWRPATLGRRHPILYLLTRSRSAAQASCSHACA